MQSRARKAAKKKARKGIRQATTGQRGLPLTEVIRAELFQTVIAAGLARVSEMLEEDREQLCGPRYRHDSERQRSRAGHVQGELAMGGRRVSIRRPRVRGQEGEVPLPTWEIFSGHDPLQQRALEQMVVGVSTRKYARSLESVGASISTRGTDKSCVSRRFVKGTQRRLDALMQKDLSELDLVALLIDGVHFEEHVVLVALGIAADGRKHVLGLCEGATENTAACKALLGNLVERGLKTDRSLLVVIDGGKALRSGIRDFFGARALVQRCQVHKKRNVKEHLPESKHASVMLAMQQAYDCGSYDKAKKLLNNLARSLERDHPGAAGSLREGLEETLTVIAFGLPKALERVLRTTNSIENVMGTVRSVSKRVKRWRDGSMILRWVGAGLNEASQGFRRVQGYRGIPKLVTALRANDQEMTYTQNTLDQKKRVA